MTLNSKKKKDDNSTLLSSPIINDSSRKNSSLASSIEIVADKPVPLPRKEQSVAKVTAPENNEMKQSPISFSSTKKEEATTKNNVAATTALT